MSHGVAEIKTIGEWASDGCGLKVLVRGTVRAAKAQVWIEAHNKAGAMSLFLPPAFDHLRRTATDELTAWDGFSVSRLRFLVHKYESDDGATLCHLWMGEELMKTIRAELPASLKMAAEELKRINAESNQQPAEPAKGDAGE